MNKAQIKRLKEELIEFNKRKKQQGRHSERMTFDEYVDYCYGRKKEKLVSKNKYEPKEVYRRDLEVYASLSTNRMNTFATDKKEYTGDLIKGIATMHKSNAVPVINQEEAESISKMRR